MTDKLRAAEIASKWFPDAAMGYRHSGHSACVDAMLAFAAEEVAKERALQENTIATLNRECDDLNNKVVAQIKVIDDVAMMGRRLGYALKRAGTNDALVRQCVELFKKYDLGGSIVRAEAIERAAIAQGEKA